MIKTAIITREILAQNSEVYRCSESKNYLEIIKKFIRRNLMLECNSRPEAQKKMQNKFVIDLR